MTTTCENGSPELVDRLNDPQTAATLHQLLDRAGDIDRLISTVEKVQEQLPSLLAIGTDLLDGFNRQAADDGIDLQQRTSGVLRLLEQITAPSTLATIEKLVGRLSKIEEHSQLLDNLPNLAATFMDIFDEWVQRLKEDDIDIETSLTQGLHAVLWLGQRVSEVELDRIGMLLRSDVLDEHAVQVVAMAGTALARCQQGACELDSPKRVGLIGLIRAMRDPSMQRAVAFGLRFSQCFGNSLIENQSSN